MPDERQVDPMLLRLMRRPGQNTTTPGAGLIGDPFLLRQLQNMQPRIMGGSRVMGGMGKSMPGFSPAMPGAGATIKPNQLPQDNVAQGEFSPGELETLAGPHLNKPVQGGNIDPTKADRTPWMNANDKQNILKQRLDNMKASQRDNDWKFQMALMEQRERIKSQQPEKPVFNKPPASVSPMLPEIKPRQPLATRQIYKAATNLDKKGLKEEAIKARQYNFQTERLRDKIKDYHLAHTDLNAWTEKNAVPDVEAGMEEMDRLNEFLKFAKQPTMNFPEYKEMKRYELQDKMRRQGFDGFYAELKSNLTSMHSELDRIHKLIEQHSGD